MGHKLVLEVPEEVYESQAARVLEDDPLERFIGAFDSKGSDWADRHDHYLGRAIEEPRA